MSAKSQTLLIGGNQVGLERDLEPWLLPEGAYPILENAYVFRQRVRRKRCFQFFGRLRRVRTAQALGNTDGAGNFSVNIVTQLTLETNAEIQPGSITVSVAGGPVETFTEPATPDGTLVGNQGGTGTINYATGALTLSGTNVAQAVTITFAYFPSLPVMGLRERENPLLVNREQTIAFDTKYAYTIAGGQWTELASTAATTWNGSDSQFFYTSNFQLFGSAPSEGVYFIATNFNFTPGGTSDPIRYHNNATWTDLTPILRGFSLGPPPTGTLYLLQARMLIPYKGRLVALNTVEGDQTDFAGTNTRQPQRARWSQVGDFTTSQAWLDDTPGRGGFIDAPTGEAIVGAEFIKDNLIVYFERSSWLLDYTGDVTLPFIWRRINSELGAEGTFSTWSFDDYAVGVGDVGLHICNGHSTKRFDNPIPDEIFKFQNQNNGPDRIYAVRDYWNELLYVSYPQNDDKDQKFPNRVLVYNYRNDSWSKNIDSFTCYGYYQRTSNFTWASATYPWGSATGTWQGEITNTFIPIIMAGNQQGFTLIQNDITNNQQTLTVQAISGSTITSVDHNLVVGDYITFQDLLGVTLTPDVDVYKITSITDSDNFVINATATGTYLGGGTITVLHNFRVATKRINPFLSNRVTVRLEEVNFFLDRTQNGEFLAQLLVNENTSLPLETFSPFNLSRQTREGNIVYTKPEPNSTFQPTQEKIWHTKKYIGNAQFIQLTLTMSDSQMQDVSIQQADFVLHALLFKISPSGRLYQ